MSQRLLLAFVMVLGVQAWGAHAAVAAEGGAAVDTLWGVVVTEAACGGAGEVACIEDFRYTTPFDGCNTDRLVNILNFCAACGGDGQPHCKFGRTCSVGNRVVGAFCYYSGYSEEPTTNVASMPALTQPATGPVRGIVDLHAHQFSNLGFGGVQFWGAPYAAGGINDALPWCDYSWDVQTKIGNAVSLPTPLYGYEIHGPKGLQPLAHPISNAVEEGYHDVGGTGPFDGWPTYQTMTHQQMYYKWVERAYLGGVRMMVQLAVSNEALCEAGKRRADFTCDDMEAVDRQIQATKDLEVAIDRLDDGLLNGSGWYRIAYAPSQARELIRHGKMAVVLGIEVDSLFGCKPGAPCSTAHIKGQLQKYHDLGVRHVFPIHQYDNAFGGAAIFRDELNAANRIVAGHHFRVRDCSAQGYAYNVGRSVVTDFLAWLLKGVEAPDQDYYDQFAADCNEQGLTAAGRVLINSMIDLGFIIDVDHMSRLMVDDVLAIAVERGYPLVSGHSTLRGSQGGTEFSLTDGQMAQFKQIGGMVSAINPKGTCNTSAGFAYHYRHAVQGMAASPGDPFAAVGFSSDMNGFGGSTGPRFGNPDCPGTANTQLQYPFTGVMGGSFNVQRTGGRDFDFNYQGLAHYGLVADFFVDVKNTGLTNAELDPLLNSAESYIRLWARADPDAGQPSVRAIVTGTMSQHGYYRSNVHLEWEVTGAEGFKVSLSNGCVERDITQDTPGETYICRAQAYFSLPGKPQVVVGANEESATIRRDTTPPTLTWGGVSPAANASGWHGGNVTMAFTAADATSGVFTTSPGNALLLTAEGAAVTGTVTVTDMAGNTATFNSPAVSIDKTPPAISFVSHLPARNAAGWNRENPTLTWHCTDSMSGAVDAQVSATLTIEGAGRALVGRCWDLAGNSVSETRSGLNLDRTPPMLEWAAAAPAANAAGWHHADVSLAFTPLDAVSGVASASQVSPLVLSAEGTAVTGSVTVTDVAGNMATFTSPVARIDKTPPAIAFVSHLPAPNAAGWNREHPTLRWGCTDTLSGAVAAQVTETLLAEGAGQVLTGECADVAGNTASDTRGGLNVDATPPTLAWAAAAPSANAAGWHNTDVAFAFVPADALSGVASSSQSSPLILSVEGAAVTGVVSVTDLAGNMASFTSPSTRIDKTAPTIICAVDQPVLWPPNNRLVPANVTLSLTDALSGAASHLMTEASSSEPGADEDIAGFTVGGVALGGSVRAQRNGGGAGRVYTLGYEGADVAGNTAVCAVTIAVPHDQRGSGPSPRR